MSNTTHTPGPWIHNRNFFLYEQDRYSEVSANGYYNPEKKQGFQITGLMSDADAKLIAASPDMLNALVTIRDLKEMGLVVFNTDDDYQTVLRVIKKATE